MKKFLAATAVGLAMLMPATSALAGKDLSKVNIAIPLGIARMGKTKIAASGLVREQLAKFGIDLDDVLRHISHSGPIVDIADGDDRVMIVVE